MSARKRSAHLWTVDDFAGLSLLIDGVNVEGLYPGWTRRIQGNIRQLLNEAHEAKGKFAGDKRKLRLNIAMKLAPQAKENPDAR